jgi:phosphatidylserine decarboxylase
LRLAREGLREMVLGTVVLAVGSGLLVWLVHWGAALPLMLVWIWLLSFFRDPRRVARFAEGEMCAPADGTVTEITRLERHELIGGPALKIGIFLSIFDVHVNRSPCAGTITLASYAKGRFLDARDPDSGRVNESNTLVIAPAAPLRGPIGVRQVAGTVARRIICHVHRGDRLASGERFGMIKFGSRTELIVPADVPTEAAVEVGAKVKAGLTVLVRQRPVKAEGTGDGDRRQAEQIESTTPA